MRPLTGLAAARPFSRYRPNGMQRHRTHAVLRDFCSVRMHGVAESAKIDFVPMDVNQPAPDISILVSSYNHALFVEGAIRSCLSQQGVSLEVLVVDDGSTDDSPARIQAIEDPRLRIFLQKNRGLSRALNRALAEARGRWVKFLPSDDRLLPGCLARQLAAAAGSVASFCLPEVVDADLRPLPDPAPQAWFDMPTATGPQVAIDLLDRNCLSAPCGLFSRVAALEAGGFDPSMRIAQDYDLWLRLASRGDLHRFPERLVQVRWHGANQSGAVTSATEGERALALVRALTRDGLSGWRERIESMGATADKALRVLLLALLDSGLPQVRPFACELAIEIRQAGGELASEPRLKAFFEDNPELLRPGPWGGLAKGAPS
jgi:alpha-1,3-rhamnosyltransferase